MARKKYTFVVSEDIDKFEAILDAASIFVNIKSKKIEDGKYVLEGTTVDIESLLKKFANGTVAITYPIEDRCSSASVVLNDKTSVSIMGTRDEVESIVGYLNKAYRPEWVLMRIYNEEEDEDEYI